MDFSSIFGKGKANKDNFIKEQEETLTVETPEYYLESEMDNITKKWKIIQFFEGKSYDTVNSNIDISKNNTIKNDKDVSISILKGILFKKSNK